MSDNDLDDRKDEVWGMDEVRGQSSDTEDSPDTADTGDSVENEETGDAKVSGDTVRELALDAEQKGLSVRDLHNVNVYLYEDIYREMVATFKKLDGQYFAEHGEDLSKNKEFFNAVFRAGLESDQLEEELELE